MKNNPLPIIQKQFTCDIDGCLMKFSNEDHLMVHKKRHDMVLNLGLSQKGCSDQTPTPTRFIRNCEEVGLFQDLQNVNPFEETFRRAVEAVKTGQTSILEKSFQSNPADDTLHTPNVFPHITDLPCVSSNEVQRHPEDEFIKKNDIEEKGLTLKVDIEPKKLILGSINPKKKKSKIKNEPINREVQSIEQGDINEYNKLEEGHVQLSESINHISHVQVTLKEKIQSTVQNKGMPPAALMKVPIPKSSFSSRYKRSVKDKFSTFTKNSLKFEPNMEKPQPEPIFDLSKRRRVKDCIGLPKERIEILERNRAAATRCREKKKIYVSYIEKLNKELIDANKKLQMSNLHLRKQNSLLQAELLKHRNCSLYTSQDQTKSSVESIEKSAAVYIDADGNQTTVNENGNKESDIITHTVKMYSDCQNDEDKNHINPVNDNCVISVDCEMFPLKSESEGDQLRNVYTDHSYFNYSTVLDSKKKIINANMFKAKLNSTSTIKEGKNQNSFDKDRVNVMLPQAATGLSGSESLINVHVPQPLVLLKPFKRRKLKQSNVI